MLLHERYAARSGWDWRWAWSAAAQRHNVAPNGAAEVPQRGISDPSAPATAAFLGRDSVLRRQPRLSLSSDWKVRLLATAADAGRLIIEGRLVILPGRLTARFQSPTKHRPSAN